MSKETKLRFVYPTFGVVATHIKKVNNIDLSNIPDFVWEYKEDTYLLLSNNQKSIIGIDIPVLIRSNSILCSSNNSVVVILGMEPLRNPKEFKNNSKNIIVGLPYAVQTKKHCTFIHNLIKEIIQHRFDVYLTDVNKIYIPNGNNKNKYKCNIKENYELLINELNLIKDRYSNCILLVIGETAEQAYTHIIKDVPKYKSIIVPHLSNSANGEWKWFFRTPVLNYSVTNNINYDKQNYIIQLLKLM